MNRLVDGMGTVVRDSAHKQTVWSDHMQTSMS